MKKYLFILSMLVLSINVFSQDTTIWRGDQQFLKGDDALTFDIGDTNDIGSTGPVKIDSLVTSGYSVSHADSATYADTLLEQVGKSSSYVKNAYIDSMGGAGHNFSINSDTAILKVTKTGQITMTDDTIYSGSGYIAVQGNSKINQNLTTSSLSPGAVFKRLSILYGASSRVSAILYRNENIGAAAAIGDNIMFKATNSDAKMIYKNISKTNGVSSTFTTQWEFENYTLNSKHNWLRANGDSIFADSIFTVSGKSYFKNDIDIIGNITVSGNVDGEDVSDIGDTLTVHRTDINANASDISDNSDTLTVHRTDINANASDISDNSDTLTVHRTDINSNASDISDNVDSLTQHRTDINLNTTHRSSDGSDHSFLDQDVTTGSSPLWITPTITSLKLYDNDKSNTLEFSHGGNESGDYTLSFFVFSGSRTFTLKENFVLDDGYNFTLQALGQANSLILNESLTIADGNNVQLTGTSGAAVNLTIEGSNAVVNQDVTSDASPIWLYPHVTGLRLYDTDKSNYLNLNWQEVETDNYGLYFLVHSADRTINLSGNLTVVNNDVSLNQNLLTTSDVIFNDLTAGTITSDGELTSNGNLTINSDTTIINGIVIITECVSIADDGTLLLPTTKRIKGEFWGASANNVESANFYITDEGIVSLLGNTANVVTTDTDGKVCILQVELDQSGIKNRLGTSKTFCYEIKYKQ